VLTDLVLRVLAGDQLARSVRSDPPASDLGVKGRDWCLRGRVANSLERGAGWDLQMLSHPVLDAVPDAIVGVGASGRIELANVQAGRLFGWLVEDLLGEQIEVLIPLEIGDEHVWHWVDYLSSPQIRAMGAGVRLSARRKDGSTFPAEITLGPLTDRLGGSLVLAAVRDITDLIDLETERQRLAVAAQHEQADQLESLRRLAGGVAHDFNNLLGLILNYTALVARRVSDPVAVADLEEIRAAATQAALVADDLVTFGPHHQLHPAALEVTGGVGLGAAQDARGRARILLVEHDTGVRAGRVRLLADGGYDVLVASEGVEALALVDREHGGTDLVVIDEGRPPMRADELARQLKLRSPSIAVIFVTGHNSGDARLRGRVLPEPVSEEHLLSAVQEALSKSE
jgi:PAS domain S-box-containing protein